VLVYPSGVFRAIIIFRFTQNRKIQGCEYSDFAILNMNLMFHFVVCVRFHP